MRKAGGWADHEQPARSLAGGEAHRPSNTLRCVLADDPCPALKCPLAHKVCVGHSVWPFPVQRQAPKYSCVGRMTRASVHPVETFWVWGHVFARPLVGGVTLLSGRPLLEAPGSGIGDRCSVANQKLMASWGAQEEPLLLQVA